MRREFQINVWRRTAAYMKKKWATERKQVMMQKDKNASKTELAAQTYIELVPKKRGNQTTFGMPQRKREQQQQRRPDRRKAGEKKEKKRWPTKSNFRQLCCCFSLLTFFWGFRAPANKARSEQETTVKRRHACVCVCVWRESNPKSCRNEKRKNLLPFEDG